jgi:two-component system response regulator (stage 0 sporulation protein A)
MKKQISILIVDDNYEFAKLLYDYIGKNEDMYAAGLACDGVEAVEMIRLLKPDVVILDIVMPNLDGLGVLEQFQNTQMQKRPLFIVLSAIGQDTFIKKAILLGAEYYIIKPFDVSLLVSRIRQIYSEKNNTMYSSSNMGFSYINNKDKYSIDQDESVEISVTKSLQRAGISPHMSGYKYLRTAILYAIENPDTLNSVTKVLYPYISQKYNSTPQKVERAMRNAIDKAWKESSFNLSQVLSGYGHKKSKRPSNSEFIAVIVDRIRVRMK